GWSEDHGGIVLGGASAPRGGALGGRGAARDISAGRTISDPATSGPPIAAPGSVKRARRNEAQSAAVVRRDRPPLALAAAGSGKTRVITHRIARRVTERGVPPERILAVSFTNKAAAEMSERMEPLIGKERAGRLWLSTFHSFGVRFLGEESRAAL